MFGNACFLCGDTGCDRTCLLWVVIVFAYKDMASSYTRYGVGVWAVRYPASYTNVATAGVTRAHHTSLGNTNNSKYLLLAFVLASALLPVGVYSVQLRWQEQPHMVLNRT